MPFVFPRDLPRCQVMPSPSLPRLPRDLALAESCSWGGGASRVQAAEPPKARVMAGAMARGQLGKRTRVRHQADI